MSARYGWTPQQIAELTLDQVRIYLGGADEGRAMSAMEAIATARAYVKEKQEREESDGV